MVQNSDQTCGYGLLVFESGRRVHSVVAMMVMMRRYSYRTPAAKVVFTLGFYKRSIVEL